MTWVVFLGILTIVFILGAAAWAVNRPPKCQGCGWRQGHRPDCAVLDRLVREEEALSMGLLDELVVELRAGRITAEQAMAALDQRRRSR
jgi:hypothetical protein